MKRTITTLFSGKSKTGNAYSTPHASKKAALKLETLETRQMLTAGVVLNAGVIAISATNHGDYAQASIDNRGTATTSDDLVKVDWTHDNINSHVSFNKSAVTKIVFHGGAGSDTATNNTSIPSELYGAGSDDVLTGGSGADLIEGGNGNDFVAGADGNDTLSGDLGSDSVYGGNGQDRLYAGEVYTYTHEVSGAIDKLDGGADNDRMYGSEYGTNYMHGGDGNDRMAAYDHAVNYLYGEGGNDQLFGGESSLNYLYGGTGSDIIQTDDLAVNLVDTGNDNDVDIIANLNAPGNVNTVVKHNFDVYTDTHYVPPFVSGA